MLNKRKKFRELLKNTATVMAPGAYDGLSARVIESLGYEVLYVTGYGLEASRLGMPDIGLASMSEVVDQVRNINEVVDMPVVCDSDTGYGGVANVVRTVRAFVRAGIAGIHLEDQTFPKKCGGLPGRRLVSKEEMVGRIRAAVDNREDDDFAIIARTDARGVLGSLDAAIERLNEYLEAGADLTMIAEPYPVEELQKVAESTANTLVMIGGWPGWPETNLPLSQYEKWGVKLVIYPLTGLYAAEKAVSNIYKSLKRDGYVDEASLSEACCTFDEFNEVVRLPHWIDIEEKYSVEEK